jgi:hypothetical protein
MANGISTTGPNPSSILPPTTDGRVATYRTPYKISIPPAAEHPGRHIFAPVSEPPAVACAIFVIPPYDRQLMERALTNRKRHSNIVYQIYAEMHCTCMGPEVPSLLDGPYKDVNPSCDLCRGYSLSYVPTFRSEQTVNTAGYGKQNCLGLYEAALTGNVLSSEACQEIHDVYEDCCSLPDLPGGSGGSSSGGTDSPSAASSTVSPTEDSLSSGSNMLLSLWTVAAFIVAFASFGL